MNGYFQILINESGVSLLLVPPIGTGEKIHVNELREYLDMLGVPYDVMAIDSALYSLGEEEIVLFLTSVRIPPVDEMCDVCVAADKMSAVLRVYPASKGGAVLDRAQVMEALSRFGVRAGIDEDAIAVFLEDKQYCTDIVVAHGKRPTPGQDASIVYHFDTANDMRPELKEDGSVDFFKLNMLHQCTKGQVLAEIIPEEKGEDGLDVHGVVIPAREVKKKTFAHGRNLEISEDGRSLLSMVDGHVSLIEGTVFVTDVYSVEDVSTATGNIEYKGDVEVKGNVCENFSVKTDGNVFVTGVVEGASIEATGNIIIARGMHGQNKGRLKAGGNIVAKFISAATVEADGFVEAEQIINAKVTAGKSVNAEAGKGLITGGKIIAQNAVSVKNAGSPMGAATIIEVGSNPEAKKKLAQLQKSVGEKSKAIPEMKKAIEDAARKLKAGIKITQEQFRNAKAMQVALAESQAKIKAELKEIERLDKMLKGDGNAHIDIYGTMYQGVVVSISGASTTVKSEYTFCRLIKKDADVASTNL